MSISRRKIIAGVGASLLLHGCKTKEAVPTGVDVELDMLLYDTLKAREGIVPEKLERIEQIFSRYTPEQLTQLSVGRGEHERVPVFCDIIKMRSMRTKHGVLANKDSYVQLVESMIDKGIDINVASTPWKNTALHNAVSEGDKEVFDLLITRKANPNVQNESGNTPLHFAYAPGRPPYFAEQLIKAGADRTIKNKKGEVPRPGNKVELIAEMGGVGAARG